MLEQLALAYVARFATSAGKLEAYLKRKLRERGWTGEDEPQIAALVETFVAKGWIDDQAYARARAGDLLRRGYGKRRIAGALYAAGIGEEMRESCAPDLLHQCHAALAMARKRRFGPFGAAQPQIDAEAHRARREKQLAAMLRAGHDFAIARQIVDAPDMASLDDWLAGLGGQEDEDFR